MASFIAIAFEDTCPLGHTAAMGRVLLVGFFLTSSAHYLSALVTISFMVVALNSLKLMVVDILVEEFGVDSFEADSSRLISSFVT